jgi:hypothetical protein
MSRHAVASRWWRSIAGDALNLRVAMHLLAAVMTCASNKLTEQRRR